MTNSAAAADLFLRITDAMALRDLEDAQPDVESDPLYGLSWVEISREILAHEQEEYLERQEREILSRERYNEYWG